MARKATSKNTAMETILSLPAIDKEFEEPDGDRDDPGKLNGIYLMIVF
ncbi:MULTISPECIES: hypothetical protein [Nitrosococcus]|nr:MULTISPECIES: hypothetical protein [Nitrosococcus]EDZ65228.1 hypothetical protein NOC27_3392 [Nitrosococcus oceani AFC27]BBM60801.1 hypothetical protein NONS58_P0150 [Nitrosococcus oceani]